MIKLSDFQTKNALPPEMKTPERIAMCYAFDQQKKKFIDRIKRVHIWADLDNVSDDKLDFLAVENRVLFYNSDLTPDVKRKLILNSIYWYMKLGTRQAMEEMIDIVFGNENTSVEEWYTYAGEAFHFRIAVGTEVTQTSIKEFLRYLNKVKNARSRFDYMVFQNGITLTINSKSEYAKFVYTFCGDMECGTYPEISVGMEGQEIEITLEGQSEAASTIYTESGTTPDISVRAALEDSQIGIQTVSDANTIIYPSDSETESGTAPDVSIGAQLNEVQVDLEGVSGSDEIVYPSDSELESGTYPDISTGLSTAESGVSATPESDGFNLYYNTDADKYAAEE
ncbi:phage tail protein [Anaerocolumna xylanovorans]|uniref:Phage tail protein (Tail_P2_I) n=1 Tax=Anaerocolumna xylanovorans DSM 12503 TaxID=1121345 RepID=A0A1M7YBP4_9FIRM|nr:phage tail protein [Anaerocolumna xylanovorans]SHO50060.1 Phage tail protein (Tail_P2_I) [Anaerocolumna xylanovorans DSM 12503]